MFLVALLTFVVLQIHFNVPKTVEARALAHILHCKISSPLALSSEHGIRYTPNMGNVSPDRKTIQFPHPLPPQKGTLRNDSKTKLAKGDLLVATSCSPSRGMTLYRSTVFENPPDKITMGWALNNKNFMKDCPENLGNVLPSCNFPPPFIFKVYCDSPNFQIMLAE